MHDRPPMTPSLHAAVIGQGRQVTARRFPDRRECVLPVSPDPDFEAGRVEPNVRTHGPREEEERSRPGQPGPRVECRCGRTHATRTRSLCATTWPLVILGSFGIIVLRFSSRIHVATIFVDSWPC